MHWPLGRNIRKWGRPINWATEPGQQRSSFIVSRCCRCCCLDPIERSWCRFDSKETHNGGLIGKRPTYFLFLQSRLTSFLVGLILLIGQFSGGRKRKWKRTFSGQATNWDKKIMTPNLFCRSANTEYLSEWVSRTVIVYDRLYSKSLVLNVATQVTCSH